MLSRRACQISEKSSTARGPFFVPDPRVRAVESVWRRGSGSVLPPVRFLLVVSWAMSARVDPPETVPRNPPFWIRDPPIKSSLHRLGLPGSLDTWGVDSGAIYTWPSDWPSPPSTPTTRRYRWDIDTFSPDPFWIPRGIDEIPLTGS